MTPRDIEEQFQNLDHLRPQYTREELTLATDLMIQNLSTAIEALENARIELLRAKRQKEELDVFIFG